MVKNRLHPKWYLCGLLIALGLVCLLLLPGYHTMGLVLSGLGALIPFYHGLGHLRKYRGQFGRWCTWVVTVCLLILFSAMALTCGLIVRSSFGTADPQSKYLVVLGAGVNGTTPSRSLRERLDSAYDYLTDHPDAVAIVSGCQGKGEDITEGECMFRYLTEKGIPADRVWKEEAATNTLENLRYSLDIIKQRTGQVPDSIAIVSSEYHLHRAGIFAGWLNVKAELIPAKTDVVPLRWNYYLREIFAVWYYSIIGGNNYAG